MNIRFLASILLGIYCLQTLWIVEGSYPYESQQGRLLGMPILKAGFGITSEKPSFVIEGNKRVGNDSKIWIPIAKIKTLTLKEENLEKIFSLANQFTLNTPYPIIYDSRWIDGHLIHRPNHNGTHSARQARSLEALFDLIEKKGVPAAQKNLKNLSAYEKINLKLAAYFLRAGRVDETSHKTSPADDYYTRSALIYEAYAKQLGVSSALIEWTKAIIVDSCKPIQLCRKANADPKSQFAYDLLTTVHEIDLVRCFAASRIADTAEKTKIRLSKLIHRSEKNGDLLYEFAKTLCAVTGSSRTVDGYKGNAKLFADCSINGNICWRKVHKTPFPEWE
ncbi:MAG: hypothetical protein H0V82_05855 [Candidatus Protochlamydia sp.]|nr:hypothetical protein [Candidatus Protochlamydia sp.]